MGISWYLKFQMKYFNMKVKGMGGDYYWTSQKIYMYSTLVLQGNFYGFFPSVYT